jgi:hypothetical protein
MAGYVALVLIKRCCLRINCSSPIAINCVHRMREHENQIPRIMIGEVPNRWQLQELKRGVQVSHATGELSDSRTVQDPMGQWTFSQLTTQFESLFSSAARSPECSAILSDALERWNNLHQADIEAPRPSDQSGIQPLQDSRRILLPGRPEAHPSHRSPLSRQTGSRNPEQRDASGGQPKRRKVYRCSICKQMGHNAGTCKAKVH